MKIIPNWKKFLCRKSIQKTIKDKEFILKRVLDKDMGIKMFHSSTNFKQQKLSESNFFYPKQEFIKT